MPVAHIAMQAFEEDDGQLQFDDTNEEKIKDDALLPMRNTEKPSILNRHSS